MKEAEDREDKKDDKDDADGGNWLLVKKNDHRERTTPKKSCIIRAGFSSASREKSI